MRKYMARSIVLVLFLTLLTGMVGFAADEGCLPEETQYPRPTGGVYRPEPRLVPVEDPLFPIRFSPTPEKSLYDTLLEGCKARASLIDIEAYQISLDDIEVVCYEFTMLHPEALVIGLIPYQYYTGSRLMVNVKPVYLFDSLDEDSEARALMAAKVEEYCNSVKNITDPLEQLLFVHDQIAIDGIYDSYALEVGVNEETDISFHAYGFLANHTAVCQGYAQVFYMVAKELGYETNYCYNDEHIWNYIKLKEQWYHMDITWDDPLPDKAGVSGHDYFLCSDEAMEDHDPEQWKTPLDSLPPCTSVDYEHGYIFNIPNRKAITKVGDNYQVTVDDWNMTFSSDRLWTGKVLTTAPDNGRVLYVYLEEPETPISIYTARKDRKGVLRGGGVSTRSGETMYQNGILTLYSYNLPTGTASATVGTIYFRDAATQKPVGPTLSF